MLEPTDLWSYTILFGGVAVSWIGVPIVGGAALATAGILASDGHLNVWLVVVTAAAAAWIGGYAGYVLGARAGDALASRPGRWQRQRRRALNVGQRFYRRWGPLAVFLTPTWVSGALRMPRNSFLIWNAFAAIVSSLVAVFGAYAVVSALLDQLSAGYTPIALAVVFAAAAVAGFAMYHRRARGPADYAPPEDAGT
jgi:membrane protein DedA with SNARE-associated domain